MELQFDLSNEEVIQVLKSDHVKKVFVDRDNNVFIEKGAGQTSAIERIETYCAQLERLDLDILQRQLHGLYANADLTQYKHQNQSGQLILTPKRNDELTPGEQMEKQAKVEAKEKSIEECRRKIYSYEQVLIRYRAGRLALPIDLLDTPQTPLGYDATEVTKRLAAEQEEYERRLRGWDEKQLYDELFKMKEQISILYPKGAGGSGADAWLEVLAFQLSFPHQCIQSIRKELARRPKTPSAGNGDASDEFIEATRAANIEAYRLASDYRKEGKAIPYGTIAEQVMKNHFGEVIQRESGNKNRNRIPELTKEWKDKRESIRVTLRNKFKQ